MDGQAGNDNWTHGLYVTGTINTYFFRRALLPWVLLSTCDDKFLFASLCHMYNCELWLYRYHAIHKEVYKWFNISFDNFGRTSTPQQTEVCQAIFKKLLENNWLVENTMQQVVFSTCIYISHDLSRLLFDLNSFGHVALLWYMQKVLSWQTSGGYLSNWRL